jgi:hypothetical protein
VVAKLGQPVPHAQGGEPFRDGELERAVDARGLGEASLEVVRLRLAAAEDFPELEAGEAGELHLGQRREARAPRLGGLGGIAARGRAALTIPFIARRSDTNRQGRTPGLRGFVSV